MSRLIERYTHAVTSSSLKTDAYHLDTEVLMAMALAGGLAASMARVKFLHDATAYRALLVAWTGMVQAKARLRHWKAHWNPAWIAQASLDYWLDDLCRACDGTGFPLLPGIPTRSTRVCAACDGTKLKPVGGDRRQREPTLDMYEELCGIFDKARLRARRKLGPP